MEARYAFSDSSMGPPSRSFFSAARHQVSALRLR